MGKILKQCLLNDHLSYFKTNVLTSSSHIIAFLCVEFEIYFDNGRSNFISKCASQIKPYS